MNTQQISDKIEDLFNRIDGFDFDQLPISEYNKRYITSLKPQIRYKIEIYSKTLSLSAKMQKKRLEDMSIIDYGGGCGFLSMLMRCLGVGQVIYVDRNPLSVETVKVICKALEIEEPDAIICGDSPDLVRWCKENQAEPNALIATDVIEHIYNLRDFFTDLSSINDTLSLVFTTGSNPVNFWKKRRLYKEMDQYESGNIITPNYYTKRLEFITQTYPDMPKEEREKYAALTRGMIYEDIKHFIQSNNMKMLGSATLPALQNKHNTCDPETGNYMERMLSLNDYAQYMLSAQYSLLVFDGHYSTTRRSRLSRALARFANSLISLSHYIGLLISPYIVLVGIREGAKK